MIGDTNSQGKALPILTDPASVAQVMAGKDFVDLNGNRLIGTAPVKAGQTYTPGTTDQTIPSGRILTGDQIILGDPDLVAANIKNGVNIFGVTGSYVGVTPPAISIQLSDTNTSGGTEASKFHILNSGGFNTGSAFLSFFVPAEKTITGVFTWSNTDMWNKSCYLYAYQKMPYNQTSAISPFYSTGYSLVMGQAAVANMWSAPTQLTFTSGNSFQPTYNAAGSHTFVLPSQYGYRLVGLCFVSSDNSYPGFWNAKLQISFS